MKKPNLKSYKFDVGNSNTRSLGMVIRVWAKDRKEAVKLANAMLGETEFLRIVKPANRRPGVEYANVYLAPNLTTSDITSVNRY